jgi:glycerophosphoryl diester phosphodiesterase
VEKSGKREQVTIIGFKLETMAAARKAMPDRPVQWLRGQDKDPVTSKPLPLSPTLITKAKANGLTGLDLAYPGVTPEFVKAAKAEGLEVHAWTVDDPKEARRLRDAGVDSITTNRPDLIMKAIR